MVWKGLGGGYWVKGAGTGISSFAGDAFSTTQFKSVDAEKVFHFEKKYNI